MVGFLDFDRARTHGSFRCWSISLFSVNVLLMHSSFQLQLVNRWHQAYLKNLLITIRNNFSVNNKMSRPWGIRKSWRSLHLTSVGTGLWVFVYCASCCFLSFPKIQFVSTCPHNILPVVLWKIQDLFVTLQMVMEIFFSSVSLSNEGHICLLFSKIGQQKRAFGAALLKLSSQDGIVRCIAEMNPFVHYLFKNGPMNIKP